MAKIATYDAASTPLSGGDKVIGTEASDGSTKNFTVQDLSDFVTGGGGVVNSVAGTSPIQVSPGTGNVNVSLANVASQGTYGYASVIVDQYGRVVSANANTPVESVSAAGGTLEGDVTFAAGPNTIVTADPVTNTVTIESTATAGPGGTVTQITAGTGLDGGTITTTGTIDLSNTGVAQGTYTTPQIAVNAQGQITSASNINVDLQHVLDNGSLANGVGITLTSGSIIAQGASFNSVNSAGVTTLSLTAQSYVYDKNGNFGTDGQVLVADNSGVPGVVWSDPDAYVATVSVSSAQLNAATPVQVVAAPGSGKYIQVVSAAAKYNYVSSVYNFAAPLKLYTNVNSPQFELSENYLQVPADQVRAMSLTTSGDLTENAELYFAPANIPASSGDGDIELNVQYRIVEF